MTEVPALPEWMQPHCVPVKLCLMPVTSPEKGTAKDSAGGSRRPYRGLELYAACIEILQVAASERLGTEFQAETWPWCYLIRAGVSSMLWKEGSIKEWRGLDRRLVNQGDMSPLNKATPVNKSSGCLELLVFQERLIIYIFMWTLWISKVVINSNSF